MLKERSSFKTPVMRPTKKEISERLELELIQQAAKRAICTNIARERDIIINIKPLSVNGAWQGRRFKTPKYNSYSKLVLSSLPKYRLPSPPYRICYEFGLSSKLADIDNSIKMFQDLLCQKYGFNDREIFELNARKVIVPKGREYISFRIEAL